MTAHLRFQPGAGGLAATALIAAGCAMGTAGAGGSAVAVEPGGARSHFAPVAEGAAEASVTDPLQRSLLDAVAAAARAKGQDPPQLDPRLGAVAQALAAAMGEDETPGLELQELLLSHHGIGEPPPYLLMVQVATGDDAIRDRLAQELPSILSGARFSRVAVGLARAWPRRSVVLALQEVDVEMLPVPRRLQPGETAMVAGRLLAGLREPRVLVARPAGDVGDLALRGDADGFRGSFGCEQGAGRYLLEVMGTGPTGKRAVAIFPMYCGIDPPTTFPRIVVRPETLDPRQAEALLLEQVNRDRAQVGAAAVTWDESLARVARAHSEEMAGLGSAAHVSPTTGNVGTRVARGGVKALVVLENVARAGSVADAQRSFMSSPGHRANVLDRSVTRFGAGVSIRRGAGTAASLYVTELFAR
jgi:uncharacterized protein YkwD